MRIMFFIPRMNSGGAERVVANLVNELSKTHEILLITLVGEDSFYNIDSKVKVKSANLRISRVNKWLRYASMLLGFWRALFWVKEICKCDKPNIVVSFLFEADMIMYLLTRFSHEFKWVSSERNDPTRNNHLIGKITREIYGGTDLFIAQSKYVMDYYTNISPDKKLVIPNPINVDSIPLVCCESKPRTIVAIGRLMEQKNFKLLIESYICAKEKVKDDMQLVIYGEGSQREQLERMIIENKLENEIFLPGKQPNILEIIREAALFVMSSYYEGFPNALLEAAAMGLPIVATDVKTGTVKEIISDSIGIIVPVNDNKAMANAIISMMNNEDMRLGMRLRFANMIRDKYNVERISANWTKIFEDKWGEDFQYGVDD